MVLIVVEDASANHYGSTVDGPVVSSINKNSPNFVKIDGKEIISSEDTIDTPSHRFQISPDQYHSHTGQIIDQRAQSFVSIEGNPIVLVGDKNSGNDTRLDSAGSNSFVGIT